MHAMFSFATQGLKMIQLYAFLGEENWDICNAPRVLVSVVYRQATLKICTHSTFHKEKINKYYHNENLKYFIQYEI